MLARQGRSASTLAAVCGQSIRAVRYCTWFLDRLQFRGLPTGLLSRALEAAEASCQSHKSSKVHIVRSRRLVYSQPDKLRIEQIQAYFLHLLVHAGLCSIRLYRTERLIVIDAP